MSKRHVIAAASTAALITASAFLIAPTAFADRNQAEPVAGSTVATSVTGCVVRFTDAGPRILNDDKHICTGATGVSVDEHGNLVVNTTARGAVITATVEEDETLSRRGIIAGPSVAVGTTRIAFYSTKTNAAVRADSDVLKGDLSNIWLTWVNVAA